MIPELTVDEAYVKANWKDEKSQKEVIELCEAVALGTSDDYIPVYQCEDFWLEMGIYKEFKKLTTISDFFVYGYCDTQDALKKYLKKYVESVDNYYVHFGVMSLEYEKYYKQGSYINKDGIDTEDDYWPYIDEHPEMKVDQEFEGKWLTFSIRKLC